jgi:translation initiation factor 2B subunit (eIF-2B alpha/beta/delta family)
VKVENVYFEEVPQRLFTAIITETGCLKPRQASACFSEMRIAPELRNR